jgi:predicted MPP superfamily phosphohydrolase
VLASLLAFSLGPLGISLWLASSFLAVFPKKRARLLAGAAVLSTLLATGWLPGLRLYRRLGALPGSPVTAGEVVLLGYLTLGALVGSGIVVFGRRRAPQPSIPCTRESDLGLGKRLLSLHRRRKPLSPFSLLPWNQAYQASHRDWEIPLRPGGAALAPDLDGFTILHLSDFHYGSYLVEEYFEAVRDYVRGLDYDVLALTGDFLDRRGSVESLGRWLEGFQAKGPVLGILGNHDILEHPLEELRRTLTRAGVRLLGGEVELVRRGAAAVGFAGLDYQNWWRPFPLAELRRRIPDGALPVLLTHTPCLFPQAARDFPLVLCGHTHGGQIRLPGVGALFVPARYGRRYQMGLYQEGGSYLHVHPGMGGRPPLRVACAPEITRLVLRGSAAPARGAGTSRTSGPSQPI